MRNCGILFLLLALFPAEALAQGIVLERLIVEPEPRVPERGPEPRGGWPIRLVDQKIRVTVEDQAAVFDVTQVFSNPNAWPGEGVYLFPLPEGASVSRFTMRMGDTEVPGEVLDANRARDIYFSIV